MHEWIAAPAALDAFCDDLQGAERIALDTEFMRVRTYWPELALVQVALHDRVVLIDPVAVPQLEALATVLVGQGARKIMHSASEDLVALARIGAQPLLPLFDTQIAASFAGLGAGLGYQRLVAALLGIEIAKDETRSDWLKRPLSARQLEYAAIDVLHLEAIHQALSERLIARGMLDWCLEDCERLAGAATQEELPANPHWEIKSCWRWPVEMQARLRRLLVWRERTARTIDRPRLWVMDNSVAVELIEREPVDEDVLRERLKSQRAFPKRETAALMALLRAPLQGPDAVIAPIPSPLRGDDERSYGQLRDRVAARAQALDLPPALLAPRRLLEAIVRGQRPPELSGWRTAALKEILADFPADSGG